MLSLNEYINKTVAFTNFNLKIPHLVHGKIDYNGNYIIELNIASPAGVGVLNYSFKLTNEMQVSDEHLIAGIKTTLKEFIH